MYCANCGTKLDDGTRFCHNCGTQQESLQYTPPPQEPAYVPPVYEAPPEQPPQEPAYIPPVYEVPQEQPQQEPAYIPPVYEAPPEQPQAQPEQPPQEPAYVPPVYEAPPEQPQAPPEPPPQEPAYAPPVYEAPPEQPPQEQPPQEPAYVPPVYEAPPEQPPQEQPPQEPAYVPPVYEPPSEQPPQKSAGYPDQFYAPPPAYPPAPPPPPPAKTGSNKKLLMILIPIIVVVVALGALVALEALNIIDIIPSWPKQTGTQADEPDDSDTVKIERPSALPPPSRSPSPPPPELPPVMVMSGYGGDMSIEGATEVLFTPDRSGVWVLRTWDSIGDPMLTLSDSIGNGVAYDDDRGGGDDAMIAVPLNAGEEYCLTVHFLMTDNGSCTLSASLAGSLPNWGGGINIWNPTGVTFTPDTTGVWELRTSENGFTDPKLFLLDENGYDLDWDDDSAGASNALITYYLEAGKQYIILATFADMIYTGSYVLTVAPEPDKPEVDGVIPGEGGQFVVGAPSLLEFTPDMTGIWVFKTTNDDDYDPALALYDSNGDWLVADDDSGDNGDALILWGLDEGVTYYLLATCYEDDEGTYALSVFYLPILIIEDGAGVYSVEGATGFVLTADKTGVWEFYTQADEWSDPFLCLFNEESEVIAFNDDFDGGPDAYVTAYLTEGEMILIFAGFYSGNAGSYLLYLNPQ